MGFFYLTYMKKLVVLALCLGLYACGTTADVKKVDPEAAAQTTGAVASDNTSKQPPAQTSSSQQYSQKEITDASVSSAEVRAHMEFLAADARMGRETGTEGIEEAATYITKRFQDAGIKPYFNSFRDKFSAKGMDAYNILGVVEGNDPALKNEYILVGAHYDHIGKAKAVQGDVIANGANDNASGTTAVIEIAEYFAKANTNGRSIIFALFSAEEMGLLGSAHLAQRLKGQNLNLYTMFNIEMIGVPMTGRDYLAYLTGYENSNMAEKFNSYTGEKILGFLPQAKEYNLFKRSDNYPFYEAFKIPAQTVSTFDFTNYNYYHHVDDEVSEMNFEHMSTLISKLIPGLVRMSNTPTQEIKLYE